MWCRARLAGKKSQRIPANEPISSATKQVAERKGRTRAPTLRKWLNRRDARRFQEKWGAAFGKCCSRLSLRFCLCNQCSLNCKNFSTH